MCVHIYIYTQAYRCIQYARQEKQKPKRNNLKKRLLWNKYIKYIKAATLSVELGHVGVTSEMTHKIFHWVESVYLNLGDIIFPLNISGLLETKRKET